MTRSRRSGTPQEALCSAASSRKLWACSLQQLAFGGPAGDGGGWRVFQAVFRSRRSVADPLRTVDGVPILEEPYGHRRGAPSPGLSLYGSLQAHRDGPPPTAASAEAQVDDPSIRPHHRSVGPGAPAHDLPPAQTCARDILEPLPSSGRNSVLPLQT